jgi:hypothetical protein
VRNEFQYVRIMAAYLQIAYGLKDGVRRGWEKQADQNVEQAAVVTVGSIESSFDLSV